MENVIMKFREIRKFCFRNELLNSNTVMVQTIKRKRIKHPTAKLKDYNLSVCMNSSLLTSVLSKKDFFNSSGSSNDITSNYKEKSLHTLVEEERAGQKELRDADWPIKKPKNRTSNKKVGNKTWRYKQSSYRNHRHLNLMIVKCAVQINNRL